MATVPPTQASAIAEYLEVPLHGPDIIVQQVNSLSNATNGSLAYVPSNRGVLH